jgi:serine/threonine protein phosphatase 1
MHYVVSDIHGQYSAFLALLDLIGFSSRDRLCVLGDAVDRGPDGIAVLQHIMRAKNTSMILGNHESMMFDSIIDGDLAGGVWYYNGGKATYDDYERLSAGEKVELLTYISRLKYQHTVTVGGRKFTLVHGRPKLSAYEQRRFEMLTAGDDFGRGGHDPRIWGEFVPVAIKRYGTTFVFGHQPTWRYQNKTPWQIYFGDGCIGIDCGCAHGEPPGRLGCLRLEDLGTFYVDLEPNIG